jgi:membrane protease YdiL (CAAX protease family)
VKTWELLFDQFAGYALLFGALVAIFRLQYGRPFWKSLAWTGTRVPLIPIVFAGVAAVAAVSVLANAIHTPNTGNPMMDLLKDRTSIVLIAIFGVTLGPLCEELAFRGFLQPLLVRSLGAVPGILAAALPFGLLHYQEYGNSWKYVLLISLAGAAFGWMRHATGSTRAAALMHAVYNALFFVAFLAQTRLPAK